MTEAPAPKLAAALEHWPGAVAAVVAGRVAASNGCLERLIGGPAVGRAIAELLDPESSARKWERIAALDPRDAGRAWELIFRDGAGLAEPRTFSAAAGDDAIWLIEHPIDQRVEAMAGEMASLNSELATTQRALVKEQARLAAVLEDLERSNAALDEFAHAASHDLKAPLRAILDYAELLEGEVAARLSDEQRGYLARVAVLSRKMRRMIDAVLEYARIGRATSDRETADSGAVIREVLDFLAPPPDVAIAVAPGMPAFEMERVPFEQVFRNLLSNAIKYRRPEGARIEVSVVDDGAAWRFVVADNGPGIPASEQERIWRLFQTSRPQDGTGIGLALVKRIVDSQGGRVSLESTPGTGARFSVTWPKHPRSGARIGR